MQGNDLTFLIVDREPEVRSAILDAFVTQSNWVYSGLAVGKSFGLLRCQSRQILVVQPDQRQSVALLFAGVTLPDVSLFLADRALTLFIATRAGDDAVF